MHDVAVVGAGPAGASAAYALARAGLKVVLLEKEPIPRYKTCGGGLVGRGRRLLPFDLTPVVQRECHRVDLCFADVNLGFSCVREYPIISMTMRDQLDALLTTGASDAGAEVIPSCRVNGLRVERQRVTLSTSRGVFPAAFVIAADGATGVVAKHAGWRPARSAIPALECEVTVADDLFAELSDAARFDFGVVPHGYGWVFPKEAHLSVGVLTTRRGRTGLSDYLQQYLATRNLQGALKIERHGYVIPLRPTRRPFMRNRTLVVGDAAGFADPITAEGISFAILSGQLAGQALLDGQLEAESVRRRYHVLLRTHILRELLIARPFARVVYGPSPWRKWLLRRHARGVAEVIMEIFSGNSSYPALLSGRGVWQFIARSTRRFRPPNGSAPADGERGRAR